MSPAQGRRAARHRSTCEAKVDDTGLASRASVFVPAAARRCTLSASPTTRARLLLLLVGRGAAPAMPHARRRDESRDPARAFASLCGLYSECVTKRVAFDTVPSAHLHLARTPLTSLRPRRSPLTSLRPRRSIAKGRASKSVVSRCLPGARAARPQCIQKKQCLHH